MNNRIFNEIKEFAKDYESPEDFNALVQDRMNKAKKKVVSNKPMFNVLPFEHELEGKKLNGKELTETIPSDDCYITYFDDKQRITTIASAANTKHHLNTKIFEFPDEEEFYTFTTTEWFYEGTFGNEGFEPYSKKFQEYSNSLPEDSLVVKFRNDLLDFSINCLLELKQEGYFLNENTNIKLMVNISNGNINHAKRKKLIKLLNG